MTDRTVQRLIIEALDIPSDFDSDKEIARRIDFLTSYLRSTGLKGYVLGISGGIDSTLTGRLTQLACERLRDEGYDARFVALRLPYGAQADEEDAQRAMDFICPDERLSIDIAPGTDALWEQILVSGEQGMSEFVKGNVKARQRMAVQFAVAGARSMLVVGTDQGAEALVGFFTKFGDGAADVMPIAGLPKRRVRQLAQALGCPDYLVNKVPTADLESDRPLLPDELALGVTYDQIDTYLEGGQISSEAEESILSWYRRSAHKRELQMTPGMWEKKNA